METGRPPAKRGASVACHDGLECSPARSPATGMVYQQKIIAYATDAHKGQFAFARHSWLPPRSFAAYNAWSARLTTAPAVSPVPG